MSNRARLFNKVFWCLGIACFVLSGVVGAEETVKFKKYETGLYRDVFDQIFYYEGTNYLHLERLYNALFQKKTRAADVNVFDEVPDSLFFTNRHGRQTMSAETLAKGYRENEGPASSGELTITRGKFEGLHPGFFVQDSSGERYLLKFDPMDFFELATSAEVIGSRFYHAIGYNVPQYTVFMFDGSRLKPAPDAKTVDDSGFTKPFTKERLEEYLLFLPQDAQGNYRASASKILQGKNLGNLPYTGRRKEDPDDPFDHKDRREIRALQVFASWLNNFDVRESNTADFLVEENGRQVIKHYVMDFNDCLGSSRFGAKPPMLSHEYLFDYGEVTKAFLGLGLWKKTWQKRWDEAGEEIKNPPAVGYFDNRYFSPGKYKTQLPYYAFKDVTRADGFWAAKIMMHFTDEDVRAMVKAGQYTNSEDEALVSKTLIERRNIIASYWFEKASPLDQFDLQGQSLAFKDLSIEYGFVPGEGTLYRVEVIRKDGKRGKVLKSLETTTPAIDLGEWIAANPTLDVLIRTKRKGSEKPNPFVLVEIRDGKIAGVLHED